MTYAHIYAGIGSRTTPGDILTLMHKFGYAFGRNAILRSGAAPGADAAFEAGCDEAQGQKEIYLPWRRFNGYPHDGALHDPSEAAMELAAQYHPGWRYLKRSVKKLIARNGHQVLGQDLKTPVDLVVCWTPDGSLDGTGSKSGGTGQALRIAYDHLISIANMARADHLGLVKQAIDDVDFDDLLDL